MKKLKILVNAYACSPYMGSEPGMAWNWCIHLAEYCELYIITEGEFQEKIESALKTLPQGKNMHFYYNPVSKKVRRMCWNQGDWRFYYHYHKWQKKTLVIAQEIISRHKIDILHQLNMIGFREPGYLWKIEGIPFVWGPTNAKEAVPVAYLADAGYRKRLFIYIKNLINKLQLRFCYRVKSAVKNADTVIAASSDSVASLSKYYNITPVLMNESGCYSSEKGSIKKDISKTLHIIWVGRFIFTKQLKLALDTIIAIKNLNIKFHVVGGNPEEETFWKGYAQRNGIGDLCVWHGMVSHLEVQSLMQQSDLFFFTSIAEGTPHVILEAMSNGLPILCFDTCGQGDCVNEKVGRKIKLTTPAQSIREFADALNYFYSNREVLKEMSANCGERQQILSWKNKAKQMIELYTQVVQRHEKE